VLNRQQTQAKKTSNAEARRFEDKAHARRRVWQALTDAKAARFPFPVQGRIPNFAGADAAAAKLLAHPLFDSVQRVKVNPDSPQRYVRKGLLDRGIEVITPTPRLQGSFYLLDPERIPREEYWSAAGLKKGGEWGAPIELRRMPRVDVIVIGSVAVTAEGKRLGKGHGYADLEYGILRELGHPAVPVCTTVHSLQVLEDFPMEPHDVPVSLIATLERLIEVAHPLPAPDGIDWVRLPADAFEEMPVLDELGRLRNERR
jgi:5-formyltetrahydrofolate cyclo-ligase